MVSGLARIETAQSQGWRLAARCICQQV